MYALVSTSDAVPATRGRVAIGPAGHRPPDPERGDHQRRRRPRMSHVTGRYPK
jgi:hypothetical protein